MSGRGFERLCDRASAEGWAVELHVSDRLFTRVYGGGSLTYRLPTRIDVWDERPDHATLLASEHVNAVVMDRVATDMLGKLPCR